MNGTNGNEPGYPENALVPYPVIVAADVYKRQVNVLLDNIIFPDFLFQGSKWLCYPRQQRNGKGGERKRPAAVAVIPLS